MSCPASAGTWGHQIRRIGNTPIPGCHHATTWLPEHQALRRTPKRPFHTSGRRSLQPSPLADFLNPPLQGRCFRCEKQPSMCCPGWSMHPADAHGLGPVLSSLRESPVGPFQEQHHQGQTTGQPHHRSNRPNRRGASEWEAAQRVVRTKRHSGLGNNWKRPDFPEEGLNHAWRCFGTRPEAG